MHRFAMKLNELRLEGLRHAQGHREVLCRQLVRDMAVKMILMEAVNEFEHKDCVYANFLGY